MALWGNNDSIRGGGTVTLNYQTGAVTGTATTFGETGAIQEGDIIRFGNRLGVGTFLAMLLLQVLLAQFRLLLVQLPDWVVDLLQLHTLQVNFLSLVY